MSEDIDLRQSVRDAITVSTASLDIKGLHDEAVIYRHVFFYIIAWLKQEQSKRDYTTVVQYAENEVGAARGSLYDVTPAGNNTKIDLRLDRLYDHFTKINHQKKRELLQNRQEKAYLKNAFRENKIYEFQIEEFAILESKFDDYDLMRKGDTTYKRIRSNNLHNINFSEYAQFIEDLHNEIDSSARPNKNIRYYKLEKLLGFELTKTLCKIARDFELLKIPDQFQDRIPYQLLLFPDIIERHAYAEAYERILFDPAVDDRKKCLKRWYKLLNSHYSLLYESISLVLKQVRLTPSPIILDGYEEEFSEIYLPSSFSSPAIHRQGFLDKNFKTIMRLLEVFNTVQGNQSTD